MPSNVYRGGSGRSPSDILAYEADTVHMFHL